MMEAQQAQQTEKLIEEMLGFLDSTSEDEEDDNLEGEQKTPESQEEAYEGANQKVQKPEDDKLAQPKASTKISANLKKEKKQKNSIPWELKNIKNQIPIWNTKEIAPTSKKLTDPIWRQYCATAGIKNEQAETENDWNSKLESNCRRSSNSYVHEVNRAIYGDITGHPPRGSAEYYQAAQNYAIHGKDFLDFPENLTPLLSEKCVSTPPETTPFAAAYGNGLYPTPASAPEVPAGVGISNFGKQSAAATTAYYQMCNGMQPSVRAATGSTAYGLFLGNKVTYVAAAPTAPPLVYNQHSSTTTNFISNSLANAALATSPTILYSNPMLTTTTQQYLNTFFKETQYLSGATTQGATTGIYERLVYAQMLQQQIYHQTQQQAQAAAVAAMFQHKPRSQRTTNGGGPSPVACQPNAQTAHSVPSSNAIPVLNLCARQAAMSTNSTDLLVKPPILSVASTAIPTNGSEDTNTSLSD